MDDLLAVIVPGLPLQTHLESTGPTQAVCRIALPPTISTKALGNVAVCLLRPERIPVGHGLAIYANVQVANMPVENFTFVGSVSPTCPSTTVATSMAISAAGEPMELVIGISIETDMFLQNLSEKVVSDEAATHGTLGIAIARDLSVFLSSFQVSPANGMLQVPPDAIDKWLVKFEAKFKRDPQFLFR